MQRFTQLLISILFGLIFYSFAYGQNTAQDILSVLEILTNRQRVIILTNTCTRESINAIRAADPTFPAPKECLDTIGEVGRLDELITKVEKIKTTPGASLADLKEGAKAELQEIIKNELTTAEHQLYFANSPQRAAQKGQLVSKLEQALTATQQTKQSPIKIWRISEEGISEGGIRAASERALKNPNTSPRIATGDFPVESIKLEMNEAGKPKYYEPYSTQKLFSVSTKTKAQPTFGQAFEKELALQRTAAMKRIAGKVGIFAYFSGLVRPSLEFLGLVDEPLTLEKVNEQIKRSKASIGLLKYWQKDSDISVDEELEAEQKKLKRLERLLKEADPGYKKWWETHTHQGLPIT